MPLIQRYLFRQLLIPVLASMAALFALAILTQGLMFFDLVVERRQSAWIFLQLVVLAMPPLFSMLSPIAMLIATILAFNRLHTDNEIVVSFAAGASRWQVVAPVLRIAAAVTLLALVVNLFAQPAAARLSRELRFQVRTDLVAGLIREGEFTQAAPGLTVYAEDTRPDGSIQNILIHDERPGQPAVTFQARSAQIVRQNGSPILVLRNGTSNGLRRDGVLSYVSFGEYRLDLAPFVDQTEPLLFKTSDRWLHELMFPDLRVAWDRANTQRMLAEAHARLSTPLYNLAFVLMGAAAILGGAFSRLGYGRRIALVSLAAAVVRILGFAVAAAAGSAWPVNVLQYAVPLGACWWAWRALFPSKIAAGRGIAPLALQPV